MLNMNDIESINNILIKSNYSILLYCIFRNKFVDPIIERLRSMKNESNNFYIFFLLNRIYSSNNNDNNNLGILPF